MNLNIINQSLPDLKTRADALRIGIEAELNRIGIETVGGMLQEIILDSNGIRPISHGFLDLNPKGKASGKSMKMKLGQWIQENLTTKAQVPLTEPAKLNSNPINLRFKNYSQTREHVDSEWYLLYFLTCGKIQREIGTITFDRVVSERGFPEYPVKLRSWVAVGFWGPAGKHQLAFYFATNTDQLKIHEEIIHIEHIFEEVDFSAQIEFDIMKPGKAFLECSIDGRIIGRRSLYFGQGGIIEYPRKDNKTEPIIFPKENLIESHRNCSDPFLETNNSSTLVYFSICNNCIAQGMYLRFEKQMKVLFFKSYPLRFKFFLATAFRMSKGEHNIRVAMVNAATRERSIITRAQVVSTSSCIVTPVHGDLIAIIPESGIYFINLHVDDQLIGSTLLPAETDKPKWTYNLNPEDIERVKAGELMILPKRAINLSKSIT